MRSKLEVDFLWELFVIPHLPISHRTQTEDLRDVWDSLDLLYYTSVIAKDFLFDGPLLSKLEDFIDNWELVRGTIKCLPFSNIEDAGESFFKNNRDIFEIASRTNNRRSHRFMHSKYTCKELTGTYEIGEIGPLLPNDMYKLFREKYGKKFQNYKSLAEYFEIASKFEVKIICSFAYVSNCSPVLHAIIGCPCPNGN